MGGDIYSNRLACEFRDQSAEVFSGQLPAGGRGNPERGVLGITTAEDLVVYVDISVDEVGHELRHLTLVDEIGLGIIRWNPEPPATFDVHECIPNPEGSEVFYPNG